jgi:hypothetical protein
MIPGAIMLLRELLEGFTFKPSEFIEKTGKTEDINFDLAEDIAFFMMNDDSSFRQHIAPVFINKPNSNDYGIFANNIDAGYTMYRKKYPIRKLPTELPNDTKRMVCKLIYDRMFNSDSEDLP